MAGNKSTRSGKKNKPVEIPAPAIPPAESRGTLKDGEPHPTAYMAMKWFRENIDFHDVAKWKEAFASCAIESNRMGEICIETLNRITEKKPVSDRYLLGLVWMMRDTICKEGVPDTCPNCGEIIGVSTKKITGG